MLQPRQPYITYLTGNCGTVYTSVKYIGLHHAIHRTYVHVYVNFAT